jgi:hypothetical protein
MVTGLWKEITNLCHQMKSPLANEEVELVQIKYAINVIHYIWMAFLKALPEDILDV